MPSTRHAIVMSCVILALFMAFTRPQHALILDQSRQLAGSSNLLMYSSADGEQLSAERTSTAGKGAASIEPEFLSSYTKPIVPNCTVAGFWHVSLVYPAVFSHWPYKEDGTKVWYGYMRRRWTTMSYRIQTTYSALRVFVLVMLAES